MQKILPNAQGKKVLKYLNYLHIEPIQTRQEPPKRDTHTYTQI